MRERLFKLFVNKEQFERVLCFLDYFQGRQKYVVKTFKNANYVYIDSDILRVLLGRMQYKSTLKILTDNGVIERTEHDWKNRYKRQLHTFKLAQDFGLGDCTPTCKRVRTSLNKARCVKNKVSVYTVEAKAVVDQFDVKFEDGTPLKGSFKQDEFSGRLHNPVSLLSKDDRCKLRIDGEELVELDVKNCQPNILRDMMVEEGVGEDFVSYFDSSDDVYESFWSGVGVYNRDEAKDGFFGCVFGSVKSDGHKMFCRKFPKAGVFLTEIKSIKDSSNPSPKVFSNVCRELQMREVHMFSHVWDELCSRDIKFAPIHDSVLVKVSDLLESNNIVTDIISKYMSNPVIKIKTYEV